MKLTPPKHAHLFGTILSGDLAEVTYWRSHKRQTIVATAKTWPQKPPSELQTVQRQKYTSAIAAWHALTPAQRQQWQLAARRASLCATGYNLFLSFFLSPDTPARQTLERQTGTNLDGTD